MTRHEGPVRRLFGPPGSPLRRRLRQLPFIGLLLRALLVVYRFIRDTRRRGQLRLQRARIDYRNRRAVTSPNVTRRNNRRAYDRVYSDDRLLGEYLDPGRLAFYQEIAEVVAPHCSAGSVIDIGCGAGNLLQQVVAKAAPARVVGVDYAEAGVRRAKEVVPHGEFHALSLYDLDLGETFDVVLCTEVLEHLSKPAEALRLLVSLCARSGLIVITVPDGAVDDWPGHRNFWSKAELADLLRPYGEVEVSSVHSDPLTLLARLRPTGAEADGR